jgi:hypothetical protein
LREVIKVFLDKRKKGQSMLEYVLLLGIVIAGILVMQNFVKRHWQGGLKESAEKMGEEFSASGTTTFQKRTMTSDQVIKEEVATTTTGKGISNFVSGLTGTIDKGVYSYSSRTGGDSTMESKTATDAATEEKFKFADHPTGTVSDFTADNINF